MRHGILLLAGFTFLVVISTAALSEQTSARRGVYLSYDEARPVLNELEELLPAELKNKNSGELAAIWPTWITRRDAEIRHRVALGDEDSLINLLLFGTSFTKQPRINHQDIAKIAQTGNAGSASAQAALSVSKILQARAEDLARALEAPGTNERLLFARRVLIERKGYDVRTPAGRARLRKYLLAGVDRMLSEQASYANELLTAARVLRDPTKEFAERSILFRNRGLSSDTSLPPNFALEESLKAMRSRALIGQSSVRRVAIIGAGLDFTDKQDGYDFYPQQTIQPFAIVDTLLRLGLARSDPLQVTTFDLSPRVNDHLERAKQRAQRGASYVVQLPRDPRWKPELVRYWERFGEQIGTPVAPVAPAAGLAGLKVRAVRIHPTFAARIIPQDLNIVLQRPVLASAERFDLIVATNIFIYYDHFEQSLALLNVERMLRPGGFLLSNNLLLELPHSRIRSVDYLKVVYSDRPDDGDNIIWYQRISN
jgi:hypothetical protein